jgi:biopolymer transport protein ExbD
MSEKLQITPLIDIAFLVIIFFMLLPIRQLDHKLEAHLPTKDGIQPVDVSDPESRIRIKVREHAIVLGDQRFEHATDLEPLLRRLGPTHRYEIDATSELAWSRVVEVVDTLAGLKFERVAFKGCKLPGPAITRLRQLPMPG